MTTKTIHTERIDGRLVGLPVDIEQPDIKAALDKLIKLSAARIEAREVREQATSKLRDALTNEADDIAQALLADTSFTPEGVAESTLSAQHVARTAQTRLDGIVAARRLAVDDLEAAIAEHSSEWRAALKARADRAVSTLTTAVRAAERAKAELGEAVGVLVMLRRREDGAEPALNLAMGQGRHTLPLDLALSPLRDALTEAVREVEAL